MSRETEKRVTEQEARTELANAVVAKIRSKAEYDRAQQALDDARNAVVKTQAAHWEAESAAMRAGRTVLSIIEPELFAVPEGEHAP